MGEPLGLRGAVAERVEIPAISHTGEHVGPTGQNSATARTVSGALFTGTSPVPSRPPLYGLGLPGASNPEALLALSSSSFPFNYL